MRKFAPSSPNRRADIAKSLGPPSPPTLGTGSLNIYGLSRAGGGVHRGRLSSPTEVFQPVPFLYLFLPEPQAGDQRKPRSGQGAHVASLDHPPAWGTLGGPRNPSLPKGTLLLPCGHHEDTGEGRQEVEGVRQWVCLGVGQTEI